jgi:ribose-phosphate pyrophosphokinase
VSGSSLDLLDELRARIGPTRSRWNAICTPTASVSPYVVAGSAHPRLAEAVCRHLGIAPARHQVDRFPDGEIRVELVDSARGADVYVVQPTGPFGEQSLIELLLVADACRRSGAARVTGVVTYFGYARQDRRAHGRESIGARVMADVLGSALQRVVVVDLHDPRLEGFFSIPVENLTAVPLLAPSVERFADERTVVVAPDLGALKLATRYAHLLRGAPVAVVHKTRIDGSEVSADQVIGDVAGRNALIVDDMTTTGGTLEAAMHALVDAGCVPPFVVAVTHAPLVARAAERLARLPIRAMSVADTLPVPTAPELPLEIVSVAPLVADAIDRLAHERSLEDLRVHR